jgi:hypothetical protein
MQSQIRNCFFGGGINQWARKDEYNNKGVPMSG